MTFNSLRDLLEVGSPEKFAITAPERPGLTYRELRSCIRRTAEELARMGIRRGDCVAMVIPNGPEMATAFLTVTAEAGASAAPLNPAYRKAEFEFYLADLKPRAILIDSSLTAADAPAMEAAQSLGIPVIRLDPDRQGAAGAFTLEPLAPLPEHTPLTEGITINAPSLFLHTSGTTSRPKLVPLSQNNLCVSAANMIRTLGLTSADQTLNIMPLFHIHGLMASVMASLGSGGGVFCTPGFNAHRFFRWLETSEATWYTAVPSMHQAILSRAGHNRDAIRGSRLRFVRSCSSTLPMSVWTELEQVFAVPVINSYGMTEASHQIACTPHDKLACKGTVGKGDATEAVILDGNGSILPPGVQGEVAIRGGAVIAGYHQNPDANRASFVNGWLRTGDEGVMDVEGNITLLGRLKEIINAGGEKISPFEIEEALLGHPAVAEAIAFAVPSRKLGEAPAAAVVLNESCAADSGEILALVAERLTGFKVPRYLLQLPEIPKGPTGKPQRIGMAARLGLDRID